MRLSKLSKVGIAIAAVLLAGGTGARSEQASPDEWSKAKDALVKAASGKDESAFEKALEPVIQDNSARSVEVILPVLEKCEGKRYWQILESLGTLSNKDALDAIAAAVLDAKRNGSLRRDLVYALQLNGSKDVEAQLLKVLKDGTPDVQVGVLDELVQRKAKGAVAILIELIVREEKGDSYLRELVRRALVNLTGRDEGTGVAWRKWWDGNQDGFEVGADPKKEKSDSTMVETIRRNRRSDYEDLKKGAKESIIVVNGAFDDVGKVLSDLAIPYTTMDRKDLGKADISKCMVLLINCDGGRFTARECEKIRAFVSNGGHLFTTDWGIQDSLEKAFPGYVKRGIDIPKMTVDAMPARGATGHMYLREVFIRITKKDEGDASVDRKINHRWEIDPTTYSIEYDPRRVIPLIEAPELKEKYKNVALAVTFAFGDARGGDPSIATGGVYDELAKRKGGRVLHVLGHFVKQEGKGEYSLQNLLLNFVIEAKEYQRLRPKK